MLASAAHSPAEKVSPVKKSVVIVLVLLAAIVLVSPAIVGRLAERSMDENLNWAASESGAVKVTSEHYDRGWFSSEGQHRIELREGDLLTAVQMIAGPVEADDLPVLIINTRLDHGLIPVASMSREQGSLAPGLGSAVSTAQLELGGGELIDLPGTIFSKVSLGGELQSKYVLEAGSHSADGVEAGWGDTNVKITTNPQTGNVAFDGKVDELFMKSDGDAVTLSGLQFDGKQRPTQYGIAVGQVEMSLGKLTVDTMMGPPVNQFEDLSIDARSDLDGDRVDADADIRMRFAGIPQFEDMLVDIRFRLNDADARSLGNIQRASQDAATAADPMALYASLETDLKRLFAAGFDFSFNRFDITIPQGKIVSTMNFSFAASDPATFAWTSLLLATEAAMEFSLPAELVETFGQGNPQVAAAIGGGYLVKKGDAYELKALLKKGLLTVNGAPIPIPLGAN
jgi:uncharacterized protein YdgA (DUF945 family)